MSVFPASFPSVCIFFAALGRCYIVLSYPLLYFTARLSALHGLLVSTTRLRDRPAYCERKTSPRLSYPRCTLYVMVTPRHYRLDCQAATKAAAYYRLCFLLLPNTYVAIAFSTLSALGDLENGCFSTNGAGTSVSISPEMFFSIFRFGEYALSLPFLPFPPPFPHSFTLQLSSCLAIPPTVSHLLPRSSSSTWGIPELKPSLQCQPWHSERFCTCISRCRVVPCRLSPPFRLFPYRAGAFPPRSFPSSVPSILKQPY
jgi:hypothetical protein